jgi:competence protein ComEC
MIYVEPWKAWVESGAQQIVSPAIAKRAVRFFGDIFIATLAAMLLTMPLVIYHFQQISVVSPLANFFVLPAQPGVMSWGIIATFIGMVSPALGKIAAWTVWPFLTYTISRAQFFASVQAASIPAVLSTSGLIAIYLLIFGLTWLGWKGKDGREEVMGRVGGRTLRRIALTLSAIAAVIAVTWAGSQPDGKLHISFLDVGQGDATLIQTPSGRNVLIDGGAYPSLLGDEIGAKVPFWDRDIDLIIATHADEDHVAGLPPILERFDVKLLVTNGQSSEAGSYQALMNASAEKAVPVHAAQGGEVIDIGDGARLEILSPSVQLSQDPTSFADNDLSIVLRLVYGDFSMLLTGDAGTDVESKMIDSGKTLSSVVFHAGHHGAKSSNSLPFLREVNPEIVVISVGEDNRYGHPHAEVLERISEIGSPVLRTDQLGAIELITNGAAIWLKTTS